MIGGDLNISVQKNVQHCVLESVHLVVASLPYYVPNTFHSQLVAPPDVCFCVSSSLS